MSNTILTWVWEAAPVEDASALLVLASLADQANDDGYCWPAVGSIARRCRLSERQVQRRIADLVEAGVLERQERPGTSTLYRVLSKKPTFEGGVTHDTPVTDDTPRGVTHGTPGGVTHGTPGVSPTAPKPSINPKSEPSTTADADESPADAENMAWYYWYKKYPRKEAPRSAEKAYRQALKRGATPEQLMAGLDVAIAEWKREGTDRKFIPHPATWLNGDRWKVEPAEPQVQEYDWMNDPARTRWTPGGF